MKVITYHSCGEFGEAIIALPEWAYRGMPICSICKGCGAEYVQLFSCDERTLRPLEDYPGFVIRVGSTEHGNYYQSYISIPDWEYHALAALRGKVLWFLAWLDKNQKEPIIWNGKLSIGRKVFLPKDKFTPDQLAHLTLIF